MIILKIYLAICFGHIIFVLGSVALGVAEKILLKTNNILRGYFEMLIALYGLINICGVFNDTIDTLKNYHDMV